MAMTTTTGTKITTATTNNNNNDKNTDRLKSFNSKEKELSSSSKTQELDPQPQHSYNPQWHNVVAGGIAGAGARFCTAPLDLLRIRRQLSATMSKESMFKSLWRIARAEGGVTSLFRGNVAATYLWIGYSSVQFTLYEQTSVILHERWSTTNKDDDSSNDTKNMKTIVAFIAGATAGVCATTVTYPFDLIRTIFAARGLQPNTNSLMPVTSNFRPPKTLGGFAHTLYQTKGLRGFYAGSAAAIIQIIPYMGLNFAIYDVLIRYFKEQENNKNKPATPNTYLISSSVLAGAISGGMSKFVVYPMDTVKKRLQAQAAQCSWRRYKGLGDCLVTMAKQEGIPSLYKGLYPSLAKTMSATALSFTFYTLTKNVLQKTHDS